MGVAERPVVVAVDGGGSKTDAVALSLDGRVVGRAAGPGASPHFIGVDAALARIDELVREVSGGHPVAQANIYLSGLDLQGEVDAFASAVASLGWSNATTVVDNDLFALLRSGTAEPDAVAVVCGTGINALGRRADGQLARFVALGTISGDWGGGTGLGEAAIWHAARHSDLRGPATTLTATIPGVFGVETIGDVTEGLHLGSIAYGDLALLAPLVLEQADAGDDICGQLVDRQGSEIAIMALSCLERLGLMGSRVPVVVGGGVLAAHNDRLWASLQSTLAARAPLARLTHVTAPPLLGAALLALECADAPAGARERAAAELA